MKWWGIQVSKIGFMMNVCCLFGNILRLHWSLIKKCEISCEPSSVVSLFWIVDWFLARRKRRRLKMGGMYKVLTSWKLDGFCCYNMVTRSGLQPKFAARWLPSCHHKTVPSRKSKTHFEITSARHFVEIAYFTVFFVFGKSYSAFANSCPLQTDTIRFPLIQSRYVLLSSNKFF